MPKHSRPNGPRGSDAMSAANDILDTKHLAILHCETEENLNYLRRRLNWLFHQGYVNRPKVPVHHPRSYAMTNKGGALLARHHGIPRKRYETGSPSRLYLEHALGLSDFMLHVERSCRRRKDVKLIYEHEILEHGSDELRKRHGWPVTIEWEGNDLEIWIVPDRLFGIQFLDKPKGKDTRYLPSNTIAATCPSNEVAQN